MTMEQLKRDAVSLIIRTKRLFEEIPQIRIDQKSGYLDSNCCGCFFSIIAYANRHKLTGQLNKHSLHYVDFFRLTSLSRERDLIEKAIQNLEDYPKKVGDPDGTSFELWEFYGEKLVKSGRKDFFDSIIKNLEAL